ncbi:ATP-dependent helicase [Sediminispirochaeta bajacaliforniensis]|uniref:ATP-dependent helicase n=1 Tax=Sediminispirochaeta bajacaliforniensis TaxID=148 RepID=UPI000382D60B|nr:UvrD-helicase domain-containing protein [Sediminispirochaeta bajacaliforniensis]
MSEGDVSAYLDALNRAQREAVLYEGPSLLILAGAGSGKTRVITSKIAYMIDRLGYDPYSILAVTFTNKAAGEMRQRVAEMVPDGGAKVMIRTFHSFGAWLCRRHAKLLELDPNFTIYDDEDSLTLLHALEEGKKRRELAPYAHLISRAKDYALSPDDDLESLSRDPDFPRLYRSYEKRLREMGNVDFGDLILLPVRLLQDFPEVRDRFHGRFRVILVDEYQDSNVAQYHLLRELAGPNTAVCVVGDDDQSIYRFRGAEVKNIVTFPDTFPGTKVIRLEENYRSTGRILQAASEVVANNRSRLGKTLRPTKGEGVKVRVCFLSDQNDEAEYCAGLLSDGNLDGTAILYRTNAQSAAFETCFLRRGIPYKVVGALRFYEREEIKDALALLALLQNPKDEVAFRRIVNKPTRGIGSKSVGKLCDHGGRFCSGDLLAACAQADTILSGKGARGAGAFFAVMEEIGRLVEHSDLAQALQEALSLSGLLDYYRQDEVAMSQKSENLQQLVAAAAEYPSGREGLSAFLEDLELDRSRLGGQDPSNENGVTLITMHNTKGLEFDRVIITGMEEGLFPGRGADDEDELEEERRIFYVSITRARYELYLTGCRRRTIWGRTEMRLPSRFLRELPKEVIEEERGFENLSAASGALSTRDYWLETASFGSGKEHGKDVEDYQGFPPETMVYHDDYGRGQVIAAVMRDGELVVTVRFETGREAEFLPRYSGLERIGDEW